jgi:predicted DNA-binding protein
MKKDERRQMKGPIPLKVPADIHARIRKLACSSALSDADVMRQAIERGLPQVESFFGKKAA